MITRVFEHPAARFFLNFVLIFNRVTEPKFKLMLVIYGTARYYIPPRLLAAGIIIIIIIIMTFALHDDPNL